MTYEKAKEVIKAEYYIRDYIFSPELAEAFEIADEALEKQMPKKPTIMEDISTVEQGYDCPGCHSIIFEADGDYCPWCGQRILWSDNND